MSNSEVLEALAIAQARFPQLRIGQLIDNALYPPTRPSFRDLFYVSDSELTLALQEYMSA